MVASADSVSRLAGALDDGGSRRWFRAPGRVNLIGDHTDYNEGFVLPLAIELACVVAAREREDAEIRARTLDHAEPGWERYVVEVGRRLDALGRRQVGVDAVVASDVPIGSGLSSSAALVVASALALADAGDLELQPTELALACQAAEREATGVPGGVMDQLASLCGRASHALLIDCRSLEIEPVPLPPALGILAVHTGVPRTLAGSEYAERRAGCERLAAELGVPALRDASPEQVAGHPLGRHVVRENRRVHETAGALASGDLERVGSLLSESHASLRDDYRVSSPELDALVEELVAAGAYGARLTGAGFGGCAVAVCAQGAESELSTRASSAYRARTGREPRTFLCRASEGAGPLDPPV
jgi:galactokinase